MPMTSTADSPDSMLHGKTAMVTGGASGIGRAVCEHLARAGALVAVVDIEDGAIRETVDALRAVGSETSHTGIAGDVRSASDMENVAQRLVATWGRIDVLVHSAGVLRPPEEGLRMLADTSTAAYEKVMDTNLTGTFLVNRAVLPHMMKQKSGQIVNISSTSGRSGRPFDAVYCASKFGVVGLTEVLAQEVRTHGIKVFCVLPDAIDTPMWEQNGPVPRPEYALPPGRVAGVVQYALSLPPDTILDNLVISALQGRKRRMKKKAEDDHTRSRTSGAAGRTGSEKAGPRRVVLVTGGSSGIGRATSMRLAAAGHAVVVVGRRETAVVETIQAIRTATGRTELLGIAADVSVEGDMAEMAKCVRAHFGRIDVLVHCAAILRSGEARLKMLSELDPTEYAEVLDINLKGTFFANRAVLAVMREQGSGQIINLSSTSGNTGRAFDAPLCSSKFGVVGLTESLALEARTEGIKVCLVTPGAVDTPIWNQNGPLQAPDFSLPPDRVAGLIEYLINLPDDTVLNNVMVLPFQGRRRRRQTTVEQPAECVQP